MICKLFIALVVTTKLYVHGNGDVNVEYGVDCSFPVHSFDLRCGNLLGDKWVQYQEFMDGCRIYNGEKASRCDATEQNRIEMSQRQPQSMVNYTSTGYHKMKAPAFVMDKLWNYWSDNQEQAVEEKWFVGNTYTNHWAATSYMVGVEDTTLIGGGQQLKEDIWYGVKPILEDWTGMELKPTSMYGIRKYTTGAILSPHVDRLPLVSSCIINVAQDVDEPWPLEVIDRQGRAINVTMEPGDMVLYESHSLLHARPFPMKGRYFANIFTHFEPTGRTMEDVENGNYVELPSFYPPYILPNSPELMNWKQNNPGGWTKSVPSAPVVNHIVSPTAHHAAATGDLTLLQVIQRNNKPDLFHSDNLGWQPIHEAARGGYVDVLHFLVMAGADVNVRTNDGSSPLYLVESFLGLDHPAAEYLIGVGAQNITPYAEEL